MVSSAGVGLTMRGFSLAVAIFHVCAVLFVLEHPWSVVMHMVSGLAILGLIPARIVSDDEDAR
jgi:hypothetical protein